MVCSVAYKIQGEELNHKPEYKSGYYDLSEDEQERLSYNQEQSWIANPAAEDKFEDEHNTKFGNHLSKCNDSDCQRVRDNWKTHTKLSKYIH